VFGTLAIDQIAVKNLEIPFGMTCAIAWLDVKLKVQQNREGKAQWLTLSPPATMPMN